MTSSCRSSTISVRNSVRLGRRVYWIIVIRVLTSGVFVVASWLALGATAFADVQLTIQDGRVSLIAKDATVRQILAEWARIGHTTVMNLERIPGGPLSLQLTDVPEQSALEIVLRSVGGYVLAPRPAVVSNLSRFERILIMPTSAVPPPRAAGAPPAPGFQPPVFQQPVYQQPQFPQPVTVEDDNDRPAPPVPVPVPQVNRGPIFGAFPQPQVGSPQQFPTFVPGVQGMPLQQGVPPPASAPVAAPTSAPSAPFGVAVPGMVVPAPQQPGQPPGATGRRNPNGPEG
jgi:hypothetical protein